MSPSFSSSGRKQSSLRLVLRLARFSRVSSFFAPRLLVVVLLILLSDAAMVAKELTVSTLLFQWSRYSPRWSYYLISLLATLPQNRHGREVAASFTGTLSSVEHHSARPCEGEPWWLGG